MHRSTKYSTLNFNLFGLFIIIITWVGCFVIPEEVSATVAVPPFVPDGGGDGPSDGGGRGPSPQPPPPFVPDGGGRGPSDGGGRGPSDGGGDGPSDGGGDGPSDDNGPSNCLIATAAFGSELASEVQFLRDFRDERILTTKMGSSFMEVFNSWYYSFSPYIAELERNEPSIQQAVTVIIYPLLGILHVSENTYSLLPGEQGSVLAGLTASALIGSVYFTPFALSVKKIRGMTFNSKIGLFLLALVIGTTVCSLVATEKQVLMLSTALLVIGTIILSALVMSRTFVKVMNKLRAAKVILDRH